MPVDHENIQDKENVLQLKGNATPLIESRCHTSKNSIGYYSDISTVSSFTHDSQNERNDSSTIRKRLTRSLRDKIEDVFQGIKIYDKLQTGKILPVNLYNILRIFCFPLTLKEFNSIIKEEPVDENGLISYRCFLPDDISKKKDLQFSKINEETRTDIASLNTEELEMKIKNKINTNLKNFIRCMWLHDFNNDGLVQKEDLKTVIKNICLPLSEEQFDRFWNLYDPCNSGMINYTEFLLKLGNHAESYKRVLPHNKTSHFTSRLPSSSKYSRQEQIQMLCAKLGRDDPEVQGQVFNHILNIFKEKVKKEFPLLMRALQIKDPKGSGCVHLSVFYQILNYFVMPLSSQLFNEILRSFNVSPSTTKIAWYLFLKKISMNGDVQWETSQSSIKGSMNWKICVSIFEQLKRNGKAAENFFKNAFTTPTANHKMAVTRVELRKLINQSLVLPLGEEEFKTLMFVLDPGHTNFIECDKFLCLFKIINEDQENQKSKLPDDEFIENRSLNMNLSGEKLKASFKKHFNKNFKNIDKALCAFDSEESGTIKIEDFRSILDVFCFPLTENQFFEITDNFIMNNKVVYGDFINFNKKGPYEDEEKWKCCIKKLAPPKTNLKQKLNSEDMMGFVRNIMHANKNNLIQDFKDSDLCNTGAVRKEHFSKLLHKYAFRLTDEQFELLWARVPKNEIGFLKYEEFLEQWCLPSNSHEVQTPLSSRSNSVVSMSNKSCKSSHSKERPKTASSAVSMRSTMSSMKASPRPKSAISLSNLSTNSHLSTYSKDYENCGILTTEEYKQYKSLDFGKLEGKQRQTRSRQNCGKLTNKSVQKETGNLKECEHRIQTRWRDILRRCKQLDSNNQDTIPWEDFIGVLQRTGVHIDDDIVKSLEIKYSLRKNLTVNYWIFLKKILLKLNSQQNLNITDMREWNPNRKIILSHDSVGLYKVLLNYRDKILKNYRDLHYSFRRADLLHTGEVSTLEFRKILTLHKIYIKDHDLFYVQDYFDPKLSERIPYNKFLKSFVK